MSEQPPDECPCGRALLYRPGNLSATCGECDDLPDSCGCKPISRGRHAQGKDQATARKLILTPASQIEIEPVVWAWEDDGQGRIPAGSVGLFAGREGTGKSSFLIWLAAKITRGELPGAWFGKPKGVVYVAVEDSWKYTIAPRLKAAGAAMDIVYRAEVRVLEGDTVSLSLPHDLKMLEGAIAEYDIAMVALDPMLSAISGELDTHVNRDVRHALEPLVRMADRTCTVVAGIAHFNKSVGTDASSMITGSGAFKDVARFVFAFATDPDDGSQVISQTKNSLGISNLPSLAYRIIDAVVPTAKGDAHVGRFIHDGVTERSVHDILADQARGGDRSAQAEAEDFLKVALKNGPRKSSDVEDEARQGHGIVKRTLDRARKEIGVLPHKRGTVWWIALREHEGDLRGPEPLPGETSKDAKDAKDGNVGKVAKDANPAFKGTVGTLGNLPESVGEVGNTNGTADRALWAVGKDPSAAVRRQPPCSRDDPAHAECWRTDNNGGWFIHDTNCVAGCPACGSSDDSALHEANCTGKASS